MARRLLNDGPFDAQGREEGTRVVVHACEASSRVVVTALSLELT